MQKNDTFENGLQNVRRIRKTFLSHFWSTICYNEIKKQNKERARKKERKKEKYCEINEKRDLDIPYTG